MCAVVRLCTNFREIALGVRPFSGLSNKIYASFSELFPYSIVILSHCFDIVESNAIELTPGSYMFIQCGRRFIERGYVIPKSTTKQIVDIFDDNFFSSRPHIIIALRRFSFRIRYGDSCHPGNVQVRLMRRRLRL